MGSFHERYYLTRIAYATGVFPFRIFTEVHAPIYEMTRESRVLVHKNTAWNTTKSRRPKFLMKRA